MWMSTSTSISSTEPTHLHVRDIAELTVRHGWQGRVAVGHVTELAALAPEELDPIVGRLREAGIGVIMLPATDLYLMGRKDVRNVRRGLAPQKSFSPQGWPWRPPPTTSGTPSRRWETPTSP